MKIVSIGVCSSPDNIHLQVTLSGVSAQFSGVASDGWVRLGCSRTIGDAALSAAINFSLRELVRSIWFGSLAAAAWASASELVGRADALGDEKMFAGRTHFLRPLAVSVSQK